MSKGTETPGSRDDRPAGKSIRVEAFGAFTYRGIGLACSFLAGVIIARHLGASGKGMIAFLFLVPTTVSRLAELGITGAGIRTLSGRTEELPRVHGHVLILAGLTAIAAGLWLLAGGLPILEGAFPDMPDAFLVVALLLAPFALYLYSWIGLSAALGRQRRAYGRQSAILALYPVGAGILALLGAGPDRFLVLVAALFVLQFAVALVDLRRTGGRPVLDFAGLPAALRFGIVLFLGHALTQLLYHFDQFVVANRLGREALGYYSVSVALAGYLWIPTFTVNAAALQRITGGTDEEAVDAVTVCSRQSVLIGIGIAAVVAILSRPFIAIVYTEAFLPAVVPLLILLPGAIAVAASQSVLAWLAYRSGRPGRFAAANGIGLALHLALLFPLVDLLGIRGAAIASTAGYFLALGAMMTFFCRRTGVRPRALLVPRRGDFAAYRRLLSELLPRRRP